MTTMPRYIELGDWIFEIKSVRAIRTKRYGDQYSAIANFNVNGDNVYVDGLMTREQEQFTGQDFQVFKEFCRQLGAKQAHFDRFKHGKLISQKVMIEQPEPQTILQLVK
ncbi:hypothetical protein tinsulaeT_25770 [Thalassotalea insulae]|uniref:Uncharacterized protein n=1 Tax=Thalassotalea insulae TaxID=2056778 RepID=A0ABQ6GV57_9GAMM|nr:hypothetical protein [Thalassotalea insulae]GLX79237.1 hypothetical protein tinsulaeT_25770 [Thalassotalea insulae]